MSELEEARKTIDEVDRQMAKLFVERMAAAKIIGNYKKEHGLPVKNREREQKVIQQNEQYVEDATVRQYYRTFIENVMALSRAYQNGEKEADL